MEASFGRPPAPHTLGYQAAIDSGLAAFESGATPLALSYFDHALSLRRTSLALGQRGKCLRDLGYLEEALEALREAICAPGANARRARLTYIAALCDARRYEEALPLAKQAAADEPDNAAVLNVSARVLEELADMLSGSSGSSDTLDYVRIQARDLRARARALQPETTEDRHQRRRDRVFPLHSIIPAVKERAVPVVQTPAAPIAWEIAPTQGSPAASAETGGVPSEPLEQARCRPHPLRRLWMALLGQGRQR